MRASASSAVHGHVLKRGFAPDTLVSNVLLDTYAKGGSLAACHQLFDEMPHRDVVSWCTVIATHASCETCSEAIGLFKGLLSSEVKPNRFVISSVINACARSGVKDLGLMVHGLVIKYGLGVDRFVEVGFINMYAKCGNVGYSIRMFNEIQVKSSVAWNAMISGFVENCCFLEAADLCLDMHRVGITMDVVTLRVVVVTLILGMFELSRNIHVYALKVGLERDCFVVFELIESARRAGQTQYIGKLVDPVRKRQCASSFYSLAISGYYSNSHRDLVTVLDICHIKEEVHQLHAYALKNGRFSYTNACHALYQYILNLDR